MRIIESTLIYPVTVLIVMSLIALTISFYTDFSKKVEENSELIDNFYQTREVEAIWLKNAL